MLSGKDFPPTINRREFLNAIPPVLASIAVETSPRSPDISFTEDMYGQTITLASGQNLVHIPQYTPGWNAEVSYDRVRFLVFDLHAVNITYSQESDLSSTIPMVYTIADTVTRKQPVHSLARGGKIVEEVQHIEYGLTSSGLEVTVTNPRQSAT